MTNQEGIHFLERVMTISDVIILGCNTGFSELETEKNLPNGAIVRQTLRLSFTNAVRNCLEFRRNQGNPMIGGQREPNTLVDIVNEAKITMQKDPVEALIELQMNSYLNADIKPIERQVMPGSKKFSECLLQNVDICRLKALIYRDVVRNDRNKAKPFVIVVFKCFVFLFII